MPGPLLPSWSQWLTIDDELEENTKQHETIKATNNLNDNISEAASVDTIEVQEEGNINSEALAYGISLDNCKLSDVESVGSTQDPTDTSLMEDSLGYSSGIYSKAPSNTQEDINNEVLAHGIDLDDGKLSDVESVETAQGPTDTYSMGDSPGYSSGINSEASSDIQEDISSDVLAYGIDLDDGKLSDVESVGTAQGPTDTDSMGNSPGYSSGINSEASSDI